MRVCTEVVKPCLPPSRRYGPRGKLVSAKPPSAELVTLRIVPVAVWVALTSAPGTAAPLASRTVPCICAVACPQAAAQANKDKAATQAKVFIRDTPVSDRPD